MLKNNNGRCVFHDGLKSTIYKNRPIGCQLYPMIFDKDENCAVLDKDYPYNQCFKMTNTTINKLYSLVQKLEYEKSKRK